MRLRSLPRRTTALAAATACSSPTATEAGSSAAASPSRITYGTQAPLVGNANFEAVGLTATTFSFKAESGAVRADELGITYIEPRTDESADLTIVTPCGTAQRPGPPPWGCPTAPPTCRRS